MAMFGHVTCDTFLQRRASCGSIVPRSFFALPLPSTTRDGHIRGTICSLSSLLCHSWLCGRILAFHPCCWPIACRGPSPPSTLIQPSTRCTSWTQLRQRQPVPTCDNASKINVPPSLGMPLHQPLQQQLVHPLQLSHRRIVRSSPPPCCTLDLEPMLHCVCCSRTTRPCRLLTTAPFSNWHPSIHCSTSSLVLQLHHQPMCPGSTPSSSTRREQRHHLLSTSATCSTAGCSSTLPQACLGGASRCWLRSWRTMMQRKASLCLFT